MPFYEYQCKNCGHTLEAMQKVNDSPLRKCPHCGKSQLTRLMSAPVFRLKGGGWYETDFKSDQDNKKNLADRPEAAASDDKPPTTADAKAVETKTDSGVKETPKAAEKSAEKAADKPAAKAAPTDSPKKPAAGISRRGATAASKSSPKKAVKKNSPKAKRRA